MGISKRELLCDYYPDELPWVLKACGALSLPEEDAGDPMAFFGGDGEMMI